MSPVATETETAWNWTTPPLSTFPHRRGSSSLGSASWPSSELTPTVPWHSYDRGSDWTEHSRWGSHQSRVEGENLLLWLTDHKYFGMDIISWIWFWATGAHCQVMLSFSSTKTPKTLSQSGCKSTLPSLYCVWGCPDPGVAGPYRTFIELYKFLTGLLLKLFKVPLDGIPSLQCVNNSHIFIAGFFFFNYKT